MLTFCIKNNPVSYGALALLAGSMVMISHPAVAQDQAAMLETAEQACLEAAVEKGYDANRSEVISSEAIDNDTVEVVLNLTRNGQNFDRLTCPFSATEGVANIGDIVDDVATAPRRLGWLWWLLPLLAIPLLFALTRKRRPVESTTYARPERNTYVGADKVVGTEGVYRGYTDGYVNTQGRVLNVHDRPEAFGKVVRTLPDETFVRLTGRNVDHWVELTDGGWVDSRSLRFPSAGTTRY